jgi:hypothetical protein
MLYLVDSCVVNNSAARYGGGLALGLSTGIPLTCGLQLTRSHLVGNTAVHGGAALYSACNADLTVTKGGMSLNSAGSQVVLLEAGNVSFGGALLDCPVGTNFADSFDGTFGPGSFPLRSTLCTTGEGVLVSTLSFSCDGCPPGEYTLGLSYSEGVPGEAVTSPCRSCPRGAVCVSPSHVVAVPGYWGAVAADGSGVLSMAICAQGYCCSANWPCSTIGTCAGTCVCMWDCVMATPCLRLPLCIALCCVWRLLHYSRPRSSHRYPVWCMPTWVR